MTLSIIVFEPETRIGEHLRVVQFAAPPRMDGLACWGLLEGPGGSRKEGKKEEGERYPRGVFIRKRLNAKCHHRVDRYWYGRLGVLVGGCTTLG